MSDAIKLVLSPKERSLGSFSVRRVLPSHQQKMVGPFIFFDHMGPADFPAGKGVDVRPHPHVCLSTVTYLFEGGMLHRDTLGTEIEITPGAVNWMTAGKGIVHSERTPPEERASGQNMHGIQTWVALPESHEDTAPSFEHHGKAALPMIEDGGVSLRLILGHAYGERAPANVFSDTFYADVTLAPGTRFPLPDDHEDRGLYVVEGAISIAGQDFEAGRMMVFRPGDRITVARLMALGGATLGGPRYIWRNFVSSSREKIEAAKEEWRRGAWGEGRFDLPPDDRAEFIPLP